MGTDHQRLPVTFVGWRAQDAEDVAHAVDTNFQQEVTHPLHELIAAEFVLVGRRNAGTTTIRFIGADCAQSVDLRQQLGGVDGK